MGRRVIKIEAPGQGHPGDGVGVAQLGPRGRRRRPSSSTSSSPRPWTSRRRLRRGPTLEISPPASWTGWVLRVLVNPELMFVPLRLGRTGPESRAVAYGTLLQCYAGFAGLNRHPGVPPSGRHGLAGSDVRAHAGIHRGGWHLAKAAGQTGGRVEFSMIEAMSGPWRSHCWRHSFPRRPNRGNDGVERAARGMAMRRRRRVDRHCGNSRRGLAGSVLSGPCPFQHGLPGIMGAQRLRVRSTRRCGPGRAHRTRTQWPRRWRPGLRERRRRHRSILSCGHLRARGFWDVHDGGVLPGLPWRASFGCASGPAPGSARPPCWRRCLDYRRRT